MSAAIDLFAAHALLGWLAVGAVFLIVELLTGSGWLLWPAGAAALTGVATLALRIGMEGEVAIFAALTIVATVVGRGFVGRAPRAGRDVNDAGIRMIGLSGVAATAFDEGRGRVFVDGKEWAAELDGGGSVAPGGRVRVIALVGGARLKVRPA
jgi:membrane protein implicated in regulation of membrane protease activity